MTATTVEKNTTDLTMTITAEFDASVQRVWELWKDPRKLERWWGPPTYPATFVDFNLTQGGNVSYYMTGPEGDRPHGWWRVTAVNAPHSLEFEDGFADEAGNHNTAMPTMTIRVTLTERSQGGTRMAVATTFNSVDEMDQMIAMGMDEGMSAAIGQMDALLAV